MISTRNVLVSAAVSALAMFAVAVPANATTAPPSPACTHAKETLAKAKTDRIGAQDKYRSDKAAGASTATLDNDVANVRSAETAEIMSQNVVDAQCGTTPIINPRPVLHPRPGPQPIVTVGGNYPVPSDQAQREHLVQVCVNNNRGLGLSVGVLTQDCRHTVPPCPVTPCDNCTPAPIETPAPTDTPDTPAPPVVAGPTTIIEQPAPTYVTPAPSGGEIVQAPSGAPSTGSVDPADRYIGG